MNLQERRQKLFEQLQEMAIQMERLRGALWLCDQLIAESEGNSHDVEAQCDGATDSRISPD